jgi:hypothetical protein
VVKEPPKLTKAALEELDEVESWKDLWEQYFREVKRMDVARVTCEASVFKQYNLLLCDTKSPIPLREQELARTPALEFMDMLLAYLKPLKANIGLEEQSPFPRSSADIIQGRRREGHRVGHSSMLGSELIRDSLV